MTTLSQHEFLRTSPENFLSGRPGVVRIRSASANRTKDRTPGKTTHIDRDMVWLVAVSVAGLIVSLLLGTAFPLLDVEANMDAPVATITAASSAPPTFHEQFNLRPTEGDVEEQVATF